MVQELRHLTRLLCALRLRDRHSRNFERFHDEIQLAAQRAPRAARRGSRGARKRERALLARRIATSFRGCRMCRPSPDVELRHYPGPNGKKCPRTDMQMSRRDHVLFSDHIESPTGDAKQRA